MSDFTPSTRLTTPLPSLPPITTPTPVVPKLTGNAPSATLHKAARDFEAIFLRQVLAQARKSNMGDTLFSSDANSTFTQMQDARFADIAASRDALGLAGMIERQLGGRNQNPPAHGAPVSSGKGGSA